MRISTLKTYIHNLPSAVSIALNIKPKFCCNVLINQNFIVPSKLELYITGTISTYKFCCPVSCRKI